MLKLGLSLRLTTPFTFKKWFHRAIWVGTWHERRASHADPLCASVGVELWSKSFVTPIDNTIPVKACVKRSRPLHKAQS
jgi:hypothetical protein